MGKGSFIKNAAILAIAGIIVRFLGFLYRVPLTNLIGDDGNAFYAVGYDIYNFLLILSSAGLPTAISRMVSERIALNRYQNAHQVFKIALKFSAAVGFIGCIILLFGGGLLSQMVMLPGSKSSIMSLGPTLIIVAIMSVYRGYFQGMNMMMPTAISQIMEQVFNAVFSVYLAYLFYIQLNMGIEMGACGSTLGTGIGAIAGLICILFLFNSHKHTIRRKIVAGDRYIENDKKILSSLLNTAFPIILGTAVFSITNLVDTPMIMHRLMASGAFTEGEATTMFGMLKGKYVTLTTLPISLSSALATAVVPSIAAAVTLKRQKEVTHKVNTALRISMILAFPCAVGFGVLGVQIIHMLFPASSTGGELLRAGAVSIVFLSLSQIATGILQGLGKVYVPAKSAIVGAIVKITSNYFLIAIPAINIYGAIISTTLCYIVTSMLNISAIKNYTNARISIKNVFLKPLIASIVMGMAVYVTYYMTYEFLSSVTLCTLISVLLGAGVYFLYMLLINGFTENDILLLPKGKTLLETLKKLKLI